MSNKNKHNSIVFLTTLSVYLGLMLVGGTPPVLAHAALTRQFDIQNEIEFKDDLDKKPDEEYFQGLEPENEAVSQFTEWLKTVIEANQEFPKLKFDFNIEIENYGELTTVKSHWKKGNSKLFDLTVRNNKAEDLRNLFPQQQYETKDYKNYFYLSYKDTKSNVQSAVKFKLNSLEKARNFVTSCNASLIQLRSELINKLLNVIYRNTQATFENNQVFIVTRLPRGSLDALLAKDAQ